MIPCEDGHTQERALLKQQGLDLATGSPQDLGSLVKTTLVNLRKVVKDAGIKAD